MLRLATDEDFNNRIVRGLIRRQPNLDIIRVQDKGLSGKEDPIILEWAANEGRVLLTHDVTTMSRHALERINSDLSMPGLFEVNQDLPIGRAIDEIFLLVHCSLDDEWQGQIRYLPLT